MNWQRRMGLVGLAFWGALGAANPIADFCGGSELVATMAVLGAERQEARKTPAVERFQQDVLTSLGESKEVLKEAATAPFPEYQSRVTAYLEALDWPDRSGLERAVLDRLRTIVDNLPGSAEKRKQLKEKLSGSGIVSLVRVLDLMDSEKQRGTIQHLLWNACGPDGLGRGGIAFEWKGNKVFAFCPGALLTASVVGGKVTKTVSPDALWFTAFHEMGHVLGADSSSPLRRLYQPLVRCMERRTAPLERRYEDEAIADFWGAVGLGAILADSALSKEDQLKLVARNLAPFRQGSLFSPHHLPFGARLQIVQLELCRVLQSRPLAEKDCRIELGTED